jgi:aminoglycoside 6'-N-acetyltransferase I
MTRIRDLSAQETMLVEQVSDILVRAFAEHWPHGWPDREAARTEVRASVAPDRISRVALDDEEEEVVLGWIGGFPEYRGHVWQLQPLAVAPERQGQGIGRALVTDFEAQVRARGALTIWLGSDDIAAMTSLAGVNLFPDVLAPLRGLRNGKRHPFEFYQKLGYVIVGALPDANGLGKPDIFLAKSLVR